MALVIARSHSLGQRRRGCFLHGGCQPLRVSGGDQQYGTGSSGSSRVISTAVLT